MLKGFGAGLAWRGFETWRQVSWRNRVLVTIDFFRSKVTCLVPSVPGPQLRSAALRDMAPFLQIFGRDVEFGDAELPNDSQ